MHLLIFTVFSFAAARMAVSGSFTPEELEELKALVDVKQTDKEQPTIEEKDYKIVLEKADLLDAMECMGVRSAMPKDMRQIAKMLDKGARDSAVDRVRAGRSTFFVFFADALTSAEKQQIERAREGSVPFFVSSDRKLATALGAPFPGAFAYNAAENATYRVPLENAWGAVMAPVLSVLNTDSIKQLEESRMPTFYLFYTEGQDALLKSALREAAYGLRERYKFGILRYLPERTDLNHFKVFEAEMPALVHVAGDRKYRVPNVTRESFARFIEEYDAGRAEPFVRTEAVPETQGVLRKVVGSTHDAFVAEKAADTLLVYGSKKCPFCTTLLPVLEGLAEDAKDDATIQIGYIDLYENDVSATIASFPTILFYPAGGEEAVQFKGFNRTKEELGKFIKESRTFKTEADEAVGEAVEEGVDVTVDETETKVEEGKEEARAEL